MWGALKKDFGEFVSTVATDTAETLTKIDTGLGDDGGGGRGGQSVSLIDPDTGMAIDTSIGSDDDEDQEAISGEGDGMKRPDQLTVEEKKLYLMTCEAVFLDDLVDLESSEADEDEDEGDSDDIAAAKQFLEQFDIETKTDEISKLLEEYPGTLQATFSSLSDQVEYADFWKRYFFRLADERVEATYEKFYASYVEEKTALKKSGSSALSNVTHFLGGVVNRLVEENDINDIDNDEEEVDGRSNTVGAAAGNAMSFLAGVGSGRPPFVLNTAVSDDDDDEEDEEKVAQKLDASDDDDEELGWDDDDEDEDEGGDEDAEETFEFNDAEKEKLKEELQQAREERDMLHKTVEMQTEEIKVLRETTEPDVVTGGDENKQIELLKMQVFERDSEIAALRAQLEDLEQEKDEIKASKSADELPLIVDNVEIERLNGIVGDLKAQISTLKADSDMGNKLQFELEQIKAERDSLQSKVASLQQMAQNASSEKDAANQSLLNQKHLEILQLQQNLSKVRERSDSSNEQNESLKEELNAMKADLRTAEKGADDLRLKLASSEQTISHLRAELQRSQEISKTTRDAEDSDSTGVKVSSTRSVDESLPETTLSAPAAATIPTDADGAGGDDDDEWGEDW